MNGTVRTLPSIMNGTVGTLPSIMNGTVGILQTSPNIMNGTEGILPSNPEPGLLSGVRIEIFYVINNVIIGNTLAICGVVGNILNIAVFVKQGLHDSANISLLGLAVSDLCSLITLLWIHLLWNPLFYNSEIPLVFEEIPHLTGGWPHACFTKITSWITAHVTFERCLCVSLPLKVKTIITPKRTTIILITIYTTMILTLLPEYGTCYLGWKTIPETNRTKVGLIFTADRQKYETLSFLISAITQTISFVAVIVLTCTLVTKFKQSSKWRTITGDARSELVKSKRENKAVKKVTLLAVIYMLCFLPSVSIYIVTSVDPEYDVVGKHRYEFFATWSFALIFDAINSTASIVIYYNMSSKFKATFHQMFFKSSHKTLEVA